MDDGRRKSNPHDSEILRKRSAGGFFSGAVRFWLFDVEQVTGGDARPLHRLITLN